MKRIVQRFESLISATEGNPTAFSKRIGVAQTTLSNQLRGPKGISLDVISQTLDSFPDVSAEWLIRGEGEMLISDNLPKFHGEETDAELELHAEIARMAGDIRELTKEINQIKHEYIRLESLKDYFENRCDEQAETIHTLRDELSKYTPKDTQEKRKDII